MAGHSPNDQLLNEDYIIRNNPKIDGKVLKEFDRLQKKSGNAISRTGAKYRLTPPFSTRGLRALSSGFK